MMIRIGLLGYGRLARGAEMALAAAPDMELAAVFSRRALDHPLYREDLVAGAGSLDVLILCGGSANDLPEQGPMAAKLCHTVDTFDTHARIPEYFTAMDKAARESGHLSLISAGWDPGLFSLNRVLMESVLPDARTYTFWGRGVSQGHSEVIRRVSGVRDGIQYTVPLETAMRAVRSGERPELAKGEMHKRVCYVVPEEGADRDTIRHEIAGIPNYFAGYPTEVHFITEAEMHENHRGLPHGGVVLGSGKTADGASLGMEFALTLDSNPAFTGSVAVASARAVYRLAQNGQTGAVTLLDVPMGALSLKSPEELRARYL